VERVELLSQYGLFLAKIATVVIAIAVVAVLIVNLTQRKRQRGELRITRLSEQYKEMQEEMSLALLDSHQQKLWQKRKRKSTSRKPKRQRRAKSHRRRMRSNHASMCSILKAVWMRMKCFLREEVTAVLAVAKPQDQVVCVLKARAAWFTATAWRPLSCSACVINRSR
jgi:serine protease SohB